MNIKFFAYSIFVLTSSAVLASIEPDITAIVITADTNFSYTCRKSANGTIVNRQFKDSRGKVIRTQQVGFIPSDDPSASAITIAAETNQQVYVCNKGRNTIDVIPVRTVDVISKTIQLAAGSAPSAIQLTSNNRLSIVCNKNLNTVSIVVN